MSNQRIVGIESIKIGAVNTSTYAMPTTFTTISNIVPDSARIIFETPEPQDFFTEDSDDVDVQVNQNAKKTFEFATFDVESRVFALLVGGTASNTTIWRGSTTASSVIEKSVQLISKPYNGKKHKFDIPHASIRAGGDLRLAKSQPGSLTVQGTVLKAGTVPPIKKTAVAG